MLVMLFFMLFVLFFMLFALVMLFMLLVLVFFFSILSGAVVRIGVVLVLVIVVVVMVIGVCMVVASVCGYGRGRIQLTPFRRETNTNWRAGGTGVGEEGKREECGTRIGRTPLLPMRESLERVEESEEFADGHVGCGADRVDEAVEVAQGTGGCDDVHLRVGGEVADHVDGGFGRLAVHEPFEHGGGSCALIELLAFGGGGEHERTDLQEVVGVRAAEAAGLGHGNLVRGFVAYSP